MKRFILLFSLCAISYSVSFAQVTASGKPMNAEQSKPLLVSQSEFIAKATEFDSHLASKNTEKYQSTFDELKKMMEGQFKDEKAKTYAATDNAEKTKYTNHFHEQFVIYREIMKMRGDMVANRAALNEQLLKFARTIN